MYCVGLTGNIASGKTTVSRFFKERGVTVISADEAARELTARKQDALIAIEHYFGKSVILPSGELNRAMLRQIIFSAPEKRQWLEQLLHPLIRQYIANKVRETKSPYSMIEIPLLIKRSDYPYLNRVLLVQAEREQQIERVIHRDNCSKEHAETILTLQNNTMDQQKLADDIINNDGSIFELEKKIESLHQRYLQLATQKS
ncbi:dephospho-CoA kinase [Legionella fairfieldensis]|uniref:dephospho-CoA kinase n=1 Tax=Legionella fairfieldensis TaxID=45064 RepID=UPI00048BED0F|nr:dephospho-CoA kinase [Legionella fairfieldensis]